MNTPADIVLGAMYFGTKTDEKSSFDLLDRFVELGGRTIDTANCYAFWADPSGAGGRSEEVIGRWLRANPGLREELTIATKVGQEPAVAGEFSVVEGLSGDVIDRELNRSLERLGLDRVDVYWAHGEDRSADLAETVEAFGRTVADGRVSRLGISNHPTWRVEQARAIAQARDLERFTVLQLTTSYLRPRPDVAVPGKDHRFGFVTDETIDYLTEHPEMELWAYSPLVQGSYHRDDRPFPDAYEHPGSTARLQALTAVADELRAPRGQVVLAWLLQNRPSIRPIAGVSTPEQLQQAMAATHVDLAPHLDRLNSAG